jgi:hypothetical protein
MKRPESTTRAPDPEQGAREGQANAECPGAVPIDTVGPTDKDLEIGPFTVTGDSFRMTYKTTNADVIDDTISDEPLPNTGGVPLLGVGFFGFICIYAAFAVLRPVIRRDS